MKKARISKQILLSLVLTVVFFILIVTLKKWKPQLLSFKNFSGLVSPKVEMQFENIDLELIENMKKISSTFAQKTTKKKQISLPKSRLKENKNQLKTFSSIIDAAQSGREEARLGPLFYNKKDIDLCEIKCKILVKDRQGSRLQIVFFKTAFKEKINHQLNTLYVEGRFDKKRKLFFLSAIDSIK
ncbi:MAG: hypothetical protein CMP11_07330 [Zetaproteobacteria bacterium]|mgnify:CR=1 FL=1|nr:hypothetical protein [Pseudobdellovibrionaceae bacterium]|tara:strand:+ start:278 stop:832 length:555 start_codon:yes stop_codon:yes gene_type:complete